MFGISASSGRKWGRGYSCLSSAKIFCWQLLKPTYHVGWPLFTCVSGIAKNSSKDENVDLKGRNWHSSLKLSNASGCLWYKSFKYWNVSWTLAGQWVTAFFMIIGCGKYAYCYINKTKIWSLSVGKLWLKENWTLVGNCLPKIPFDLYLVE